MLLSLPAPPRASETPPILRREVPPTSLFGVGALLRPCSVASKLLRLRSERAEPRLPAGREENLRVLRGEGRAPRQTVSDLGFLWPESAHFLFYLVNEDLEIQNLPV